MSRSEKGIYRLELKCDISPVDKLFIRYYNDHTINIACHEGSSSSCIVLRRDKALQLANYILDRFYQVKSSADNNDVVDEGVNDSDNDPFGAKPNAVISQLLTLIKDLEQRLENTQHELSEERAKYFKDDEILPSDETAW